MHDAARPLIDPATIDRTIDAVAEFGAAIVGLPAVDTIKQVERTAHGAIVTATIPRERIVQAQTPQGARCGLLRRAFAEAAADEFAGTDEASLLERAGKKSQDHPARRPRAGGVLSRPRKGLTPMTPTSTDLRQR